MADYATAAAVVSPPPFQQQPFQHPFVPQPFQPQAPQPAPQQAQQSAYRKPVPYSPAPSGTTTPANVSPTSPRTASIHPNQARQLRPPKLPMYVPAVLRPTEKPVRQSPPKTSDSGIDSTEASFGSAVRRTTGDSFDSGSGTIASEESIQEGTGPVTGPPSRNHWKPDSSTLVCTASCCRQPFSFLNRRHHCRRCGGIFCGAHSANVVRLNQLALFHANGTNHRACDRCHTEFRQWEANRHSRSNSESSSGAVTIDSPAAAKRPEGFRVGSLVGSAPATWSWSTF